MTKYKGSLELNWINKNKSLLYEIDEEEGIGLKPVWVEKDDIRVSEPRILKLIKEYGDPNNENMLIKGDNLLALRTLVEEFKNREEKDKVKCIYIDPPYNSGNAFDKYDDNLELSEWLTMMRDRLVLLKQLLKTDGVIFISINEELHSYLKVLMDEIYSKRNFLGEFIWRNRKGGGNDSNYLAIDHEYILIYAKEEHNQDKWRIKYDEEYLKRYKFEDDKGRYYWDTLIRPGLKNPIRYTVKCPDGTDLELESQYSEKKFYSDLKDGEIKFTHTLNRWSVHRKVYMPMGRVLRSILYDIASYTDARNEMLSIFGSKKDFPYPKPEKLISLLLELASKENEIVLDSFLGSGTTSAVAHKMGRRWIGIEIGVHAETHCKKRLKSIVDGKDNAGISEIVSWKGGGFRYYTVGESIIKDLDMNWDMTLEEMSRAVFINFDYSLIEDDTHCLEGCDDGFYLGKQKGGIAICLVTKGTKIIRRTELNTLVKDLTKKYPNQKVTIFTNMGVAVKPEELNDKLDVKKIPESILKKYRMV